MFEIIQNGGFTAVRELILISVFFNFVIVFGYGNAGGGGGTPLQKANGDLPLDGVTF